MLIVLNINKMLNNGILVTLLAPIFDATKLNVLRRVATLQ